MFSIPVFAQLSQLNDEFDDPNTLSNWLDINEVEGWNAQQLEEYNIDTGTPSHLLMIPHTSSWFQNLRGTLLHKMISGNFVFTTEARATNRAQNDIPGGNYSLAGIMMRTPINYHENDPPGAINNWLPGRENYVFHAFGHADEGHPTCNGCGAGPHFEIKTTRNSNSILEVTAAPSTHVQIRMARIGQYIILLAAPIDQNGNIGNFEVRDRFERADFPQEVQVGFVAYTDWGKVSTYNTDNTRRFFHNSNVLQDGVDNDPNEGMSPGFSPDIRAEFDFARFDEVDTDLEALEMSGTDLSDPNQISNMELLQFLGYTSEPVAVALDLLYFKGQQKGQQVELTWSTGAGTPPEYFEIEHRTSNNNFQKIATISTHNKATYSFVHQQVQEADNYYRLRQVEKDRSTSLSPTIAIKIKSDNSLKIYPNPTQAHLFVEIATSNKAKNMTIINHLGQIVWQKVITQNKVAIDVSTFAKGIYFIQVDNSFNKKIIIQ